MSDDTARTSPGTARELAECSAVDSLEVRAERDVPLTAAECHLPELMREALWCLKGAAYYLTVPVRRLPLCRLGVHDWCACCSPVTCRRCEVSGHD